MGMFDTVRIEDMSILPRVDCKEDNISLLESKRTGFQTKSMECNLDDYLIKDYKLHWRRLEDTKPHKPVMYTGSIHFYFPSYTANFIAGELVDIEYHSSKQY